MNDADKKARLAEQLRANLRKRKTQAREVAAGDVRESGLGETQGGSEKA